MSSILDNLPQTVTIKRRVRTVDSLGGSKDSYTTVQSGVSCWMQASNDREVREFDKRGIRSSHKVFFRSKITVDERNVFIIDSEDYEVKSLCTDASAGKGEIWKVLVDITTTGSTAT